ncbi:MAG: HlyD family secretion protein, partial [Snowella sp.]
ERSLKIDQDILSTVQPLLEEGALAKLQVERQKQSIYDRQKQLIEQQANGNVDLEKQKQQIQTRLADIERLQAEEKRLRYTIAKASEDFTNTLAFTEKDVRDKIAANDQKIADLDTLLTKTILQNENQIADLDSQISAAKVTLKYQELKSPVAGTVFDLKAAPGYVPQSAQAAQSDPLLKIVPDDYLVAEVNITNQDIGFVRQGMKADVRIDSFPYSEFGDIKGKVSWIGSDALKPDEVEKYYRFPAKITLDSQVLKAGDRQIPLQSGMSVTANIKV